MVDRVRPNDDTQWLESIFDRIENLERAASLQSTSVSNGRTRFRGILSILVEGSGRVDGTWLVNGHLQGAGELNWAGLWNMIGPGKLFGDLEVRGGGKIIIRGDVDATLENGEFTLANGAKLTTGTTGGTSSIGMVPTGGVVDISANSNFAWMRALGASIVATFSTVRLDAPNVEMPGITPPPSGATTVPLVIDISTGRVHLG